MIIWITVENEPSFKTLSYWRFTNYHDSPFDRNSVQYKGEWSKERLYDEMTNYGNLVLLSDGEADPLVVKEELMAGLGVVLS